MLIESKHIARSVQSSIQWKIRLGQSNYLLTTNLDKEMKRTIIKRFDESLKEKVRFCKFFNIFEKRTTRVDEIKNHFDVLLDEKDDFLFAMTFEYLLLIMARHEHLVSNCRK